MPTWKPIRGYESYKVSDAGEIMNSRGRLLKSNADGKGYLSVSLCAGGVEKKRMVHRLVAVAFLPNPDSKATVNHKNGNKTDNRAVNLEWATQSENNQHSYDMGLASPKGITGERNGRAKLSAADVADIRVLLGNGTPVVAIAARYGVNSTTIGKIKRGQNWK